MGEVIHYACSKCGRDNCSNVAAGTTNLHENEREPVGRTDSLSTQNGGWASHPRCKGSLKRDFAL